MTAPRIDKYLIDSRSSLLDALSKLNSLPGDEMTLFVIDTEGKIVGSLTDGDIRRALLGGATTASAVTEAVHRDFIALNDGDIDLLTLRGCRARGISMIPVIDSDRRPSDIINLNKVHTILPVSAILMAGGKGERLRPLTLDTPKPLLEIDGKAIIDYNVEALAACGIKDITVCTRYLADKIIAHFSKPVAGISVKCVREESPLGTLGAVSLARLQPGGTTIVMNSDLLTSISFEDLYLRHTSEHADITVAVVPYQVSVPYAILSTEGPCVSGIEEKPSYSYYANAGIYIFSNDLLARIGRGIRVDATDFIGQSVAEGRRVVFFPINGTWIDVGSPVDFRQATEIMRHHRNMSQD